jgi:hypothetical protein
MTLEAGQNISSCLMTYLSAKDDVSELDVAILHVLAMRWKLLSLQQTDYKFQKWPLRLNLLPVNLSFWLSLVDFLFDIIKVL